MTWEERQILKRYDAGSRWRFNLATIFTLLLSLTAYGASVCVRAIPWEVMPQITEKVPTVPLNYQWVYPRLPDRPQQSHRSEEVETVIDTQGYTPVSVRGFTYMSVANSAAVGSYSTIAFGSSMASTVTVYPWR